MNPNYIFKIAVIGFALFAFSVVGCASPSGVAGLPPRIDSVQAASQFDAPGQGSATRSSGSSSRSGSC